jgi:hypothetical protein
MEQNSPNQDLPALRFPVREYPTWWGGHCNCLLFWLPGLESSWPFKSILPYLFDLKTVANFF